MRKPYAIPFSLRPEVENTLQQMLQIGVIKGEASPFANPMTVVRKKNGSIRVCLDARWLNQQMIADLHEPRRIYYIHSSQSGLCPPLICDPRIGKSHSVQKASLTRPFYLTAALIPIRYCRLALRTFPRNISIKNIPP